MTVVFIVFVVATLLEVGLDYLTLLWCLRKYIVPVLIVGVAFGSGGLFAAKINIATGLILIMSAYRLFNMLRLTEARINEHYLRKATRQTSMWLISLQLEVLAIWWLLEHSLRHMAHWSLLIAVLQLLTAFILSISTFRQFKKSQPIIVKKSLADRDMPSLTVAIPARNEDQQLEECLQSVLGSDYPKLEVIVLDDCSQDKTPQIIKNYAHDGVRFVPGEELKDVWLAKNQAYEQLANEASGELILFCGVDVRFTEKSVRQMVTLMKTKHKRMLCIMPLNERPALSFAQSIRYYWELALPRRMFNRPPVLSSCWLIDAEFLRKNGGFTAVNNSITPEAFFARCAVKDDAYAFMRSTSIVGISSMKSTKEQRETAIRVRYPQVHRRPEMVLLISMAELGLLIGPYLLMVIGLFGVFGVLAEVFFIFSCVLLTATYRSISYTSSSMNKWYLSPLFPLTVLIDVGLLHYSMNKYEFSTVEWKGRNVCLPVMQSVSRLHKVT